MSAPHRFVVTVRGSKDSADEFIAGLGRLAMDAGCEALQIHPLVSDAPPEPATDGDVQS